MILIILLFGIITGGISDNTRDDSRDDSMLLWEQVREAVSLAIDGKYDSAMVKANDILPMAIDQNENLAVIYILNILGTGMHDRDHDEQAYKIYKQAETCIDNLSPEERTKLESSPQIINIYINLAEVCKDLKKKKESCQYALKAAADTEKKSEMNIRGTVFPQVGGILLDAGRTKEAARYLKQGYHDAMKANLPGNALVAASHLMLIEADINHSLPEDNVWKKKADLLLSKVSSEYPKGIYYSNLSHLHIVAGELLESSKALQEAMELDDVKKQITPEKSKRLLKNIEKEKEEKYAKPHLEHIRLVTTILIAVLMLFALYILWQRYRRKKMAEETEQQMAERYIEGMEQERGRMARELHDDVSNQLLAVEMKMNSDGPTEQTMQLLNESRERIRQVSHTLMPPEFSRNTLDEVLAHYIDSINGANGCEITFDATPADAQWQDIPQETSLEIYRIVQETIGNTLKHNEATLIATGMKRDGRHLTITVSDNGHPSKQEPSGNGIGLRTMQLRAKAINAHLNYITTRFGNTLMLELDL